MPRLSLIKMLLGIRAHARGSSITLALSAAFALWSAPVPAQMGLTDAEACDLSSKAYNGVRAGWHRCSEEEYTYIMMPSSHCGKALRIATEEFRAANCGVSGAEREAQQKAEQAAAQAREQATREAAAKTAADQAKSNALTPEQNTQAQKLFQQAFELLRSGDFQGAQRGFESGLAIDPANKPANFYLAETLLREGDATRARAFYNRVIALDPNSAEAVKANTALRTLPAFQ